MKALITAGLVFLASVCLAQKSDGVYRNTPWVAVPPDGVPHMQMVPIPALSTEVVSYKLTINADQGLGAPPWQGTVTLASDKFMAVCIILELPIGAQMGDAAWQEVFNTADGIEATFVYRRPSTNLTDGVERRDPPYVIEPGKQLYLVALYMNTGTVPLGPVTCVSHTYYRVTSMARGRR